MTPDRDPGSRAEFGIRRLPVEIGIWSIAVLLTVVVIALPAINGLLAETAEPIRPNILLIITDDQRYDTMEFMPRTQSRIFGEGVNFTNAFVTTPLCCPSRASIFTGMLASRHGVHANSDPLPVDTLVDHLHDAGYFTGLTGKYLNSWNDSPRPEFDFWASTDSPVVTGTTNRYAGYDTYVLRDYALDFLGQAAKRDQPFFLTFATKAPHNRVEPAPGDEQLYRDLPDHRPPSYNEDDVSDKPTWIRERRKLNQNRRDWLDNLRRTQLQTLNAVDIAVDELLNLLAQQGRLDDTIVIFLSDNGLMWGEHRSEGAKNQVYEEAIRVPFGIRYPAYFPGPRVEQRLVANIDIAPTLYELAGLPVPVGVDGRSLLSLADQETRWRTELLLEGWQEQAFRALRTERYIYVENEGDTSELYDLSIDPYQLTNAVDDPAYAPIVADMQSRLARELEEPLIIDSSSLSVNYGGWQGVRSPTRANGVTSRSLGGGYHSGLESAGPLRFATQLPSTSVTLVVYRGPDQGQAAVTIDGIEQGTLDLYAPEPEWQSRQTYQDLPLSEHLISIQPSGTRNAASIGNEVRVDGVLDGDASVDDSLLALEYGAWTGVREIAAHGGSYRATDAAGAWLEFTVSGQSFVWITARGPDYGQAAIFVDGVMVELVDLYAPEQEWLHGHGVNGLGTGDHTVHILVLGTHHRDADGTAIVFDGAIVPQRMAFEPQRS